MNNWGGSSYLEESPSFVLLKFAFFDDVLKEFASRNVFHDHEDVRRGGNYLIQLWIREVEEGWRGGEEEDLVKYKTNNTNNTENNNKYKKTNIKNNDNSNFNDNINFNSNNNNNRTT